MRRVVARAAGRVDLAGGSLDLWPIGVMLSGARTLNVAVGLYATAQCEPNGQPGVHLISRDLQADYIWRPGEAPGPLALAERLCEAYGVVRGWTVVTSSEIPQGSGLGGSSALSVALALALGRSVHRHPGTGRIVAECRDLEAAHLRIPTGVQDFWPALMGGVIRLRYPAGGTQVERLPISLKALETRMVVAFSGQSRLSARTNWDLMKRFLDGDEKVRRCLLGIAQTAGLMEEQLLAGNWDAVGPLMAEEWGFRKGLAEGISTPVMDAALDVAASAGSQGGKGCGAGGGGCLAFWTREGAHLAVEEALRDGGLRVLSARAVECGSLVEVES